MVLILHFFSRLLFKTTRSRQREQDKKNQISESSESMPTDQTIPKTLPAVPTIEQCAICMENLTTQEVGVPENCEHTFCLVCLIEWAKVKDEENEKLFLIKKLFFFRKIIHVRLIE